MPVLYGLIGYPLTHSFSRKYFTGKFRNEHISGADYLLFEIREAGDFPSLFRKYPDLQGLNVTIPHKKAVIPLLDSVDEGARRVGAVNVIKKEKDGSLKGYNSDYTGFRRSLENWLGTDKTGAGALVLGTGGAASAVSVALEDLGLNYLMVSRNKKNDWLTYSDLAKNPVILQEHLLVINTTPAGTYPGVNECPDLPYENIGENHFLFDLVYNPEETLFMKKGLARGAKVKNGYEMLVLQAERAWEIWNQIT